MGSAQLTCEPPCACGTSKRESLSRSIARPLRLDGWEPSERVSVTKIVPVHVRVAADKTNGATEASRCVLRLDVVPSTAVDGSTVAGATKPGVPPLRPGGLQWSRFVVSHLISGAHDPGPLTWAFDVAGSLLLKPT